VAAGEPGVLCDAASGFAIATGDGGVLPLEVQPQNRRAMAWDAWLRGARVGAGARLATA
jgi:methionyl-tRNA formyltransferase